MAAGGPWGPPSPSHPVLSCQGSAGHRETAAEPTAVSTVVGEAAVVEAVGGSSQACASAVVPTWERCRRTGRWQGCYHFHISVKLLDSAAWSVSLFRRPPLPHLRPMSHEDLV